MIALFNLALRLAASFAGGYIANDVVDIVTANKEAKKQDPASPQRMLTDAFIRWQDRSFIMKYFIVTSIGIVVAILLMTSAARKKLFK